MEQKIKSIISSVLDMEISLILNENISPDNIQEWDSMNHLIIITALEEEFHVSFTPEQIEEMYKGFNNIRDILLCLIGE